MLVCLLLLGFDCLIVCLCVFAVCGCVHIYMCVMVGARLFCDGVWLFLLSWLICVVVFACLCF